MLAALAHRCGAFLFHRVPIEIDVVLLLSGSEGVFLAGLRDLRAGSDPRRRRGAQQIRIEAGSRAHASAPNSAEAKVERYGIVRVAWNEIDARVNVAARERERHVVAGRHAELLRGARAHHYGVVPCEPRDGLGKLLQPGIV